MGETVRIKTQMTQEVELPVARQLCNDFIEWLSEQGLVNDDDVVKWRDRDYADVTAEFMEQYA